MLRNLSATQLSRQCLFVLFEPGGGKAWALFTKDDGVRRLFGTPDAAV